MNISRFEDQVISLESRKINKGKILFYGNSYFAFWDDEKIEEMLSELTDIKPITINHGFGGATSAELQHYYDRLVKPYSPKVLVWCEGANDFEQGFTSDEAFAKAEEVFNKAKTDFPDIKIIILSPIMTPKTLDNPEWIKARCEYDKMLKNYVRDNSNCFYIDILPVFYEAGEGVSRNKLRDIFRDDRVHLTDKGYEEFSSYLKERILRILKSK